MASEKAMGGGAKTAIAIAGVLGIALIGYVFVPMGNRTGEAPEAANQSSAPEKTTEAESTTATAPATAPEAPTAAETAAASEPAAAVSIENWRVEADGAGLVSGRTAAGALVSVLVDGAKVAEGSASATGEFVILFTLPANDQPSLMTLEARLADGSAIPGPEAIALAPIPGPKPDEVVAATATDGGAEADSAEADGAEAPPAALLLTEEGAKVVQPGAESAAAAASVAEGASKPVIIGAIAYTPEGFVQLSGVGQSGQAIRIYIDNAPVADAPVQSDGSWQVILRDTPPGIYTLRADQVGADGKVTARFETPFKRETPEALAALATPAPAPEAQVQAPTEEVATETAPGTSASPEAEATASAANAPAQGEAPAAAPEATAEAAVTANAEPATTAPGTEDASTSAEPAATAEAASTGAAAGEAGQGTTAEAALAAGAEATSPTSGAAPATVAESGAAPATTAETAYATSTQTTTEMATETAPETSPDASPAPAAESDAPPVLTADTAQPAPDATTAGGTGADSGSPLTQAAAAPAQPAPETAPEKVERKVSITVQPGYSLWRIARDTYGEGILYVQVFEANKDRIRDPDLIYPGQVFELPVK